MGYGRDQLARSLVIAAVGLVVQGCQQDSPDVGGRWAMFTFADPVTVDIWPIHDGVVSGTGCCGGFFDLSSCCGFLEGEIAGQHASFGFSFGGGEAAKYSTDVFVSANGQRMAGTFNGWQRNPVAWVRIAPTDPYLPRAAPALRDILWAHSGSYALVLSDAPPAGSDFSPQQTCRLVIGGESVSGDLGTFWAGELSWSADERMLAAGPVPETAPGLPVALTLAFDNATVEAAMASGLRYQFQVTRQ